jgi:type VI secretion system secreted protein VgrG
MSIAELSFESGETSLSVRSFRLEEAVSRPFSASVVARSPRQIDLEAIVGRTAALQLRSGVAHLARASRRWSGVCQHIEQVQAEPTGLSTYAIRIVPRLWLLTQRRGYRVFQHLAIPDVVDRVLEVLGVTPSWQIDRARYPKLLYKVQYGESDYAFFCRLLEEAGIAFGFGDGGEVVLADALHAGTPRSPALRWVENPNESAEQEFAAEVRLAHEVRPGAYTIRDTDFRRPAFVLLGQAEPAPAPEDRYERYHYRPGAFLIEGGKSEGTPVADDQAVARHDEKYGKDRAERALAGARTGKRSVSLRTNVLDLAPGTVFDVENHPHAELGRGEHLLAIEQTIDGAIDAEWTMRVRAVFAGTPYRPPIVTARPKVDGVQSATVVGPKDQEIHTDEFGRVRVQFPWDRDGKNDDHSSCWVRVSQGWAGTGFGMVNLPRVGQEVLVGFLEGDPDQPMVVGRVFNMTNPVPYTLPEHRTRSAWRSRTSPGGGGENEIMFEDLAGRELVWVQAEKDLRKLVKHDETVTVGNNRQKLVKANETETVRVDRTEITHRHRTEVTGRDRTTVVGGTRRDLVKEDAIERIEGESLLYVGDDQHLWVNGVKRERVEKDSHLLVKGDRSEQIGGTYGLTAGSHQIACGSQAVGAGGAIHLKAGAAIVLEAPDVTIKAPGGFVRVYGPGVIISGSTVLINSGGGPGSGPGGGGGDPEKPKEAKVEMPTIPTPDDVSVTRLGPGR